MTYGWLRPLAPAKFFDIATLFMHSHWPAMGFLEVQVLFKNHIYPLVLSFVWVTVIMCSSAPFPHSFHCKTNLSSNLTTNTF